MGFELLRVTFSGGDTRRLQIMAERRDRQAMDVDDCAEISRAVSALLDVSDPIPSAYTLEVTSPGIDRPLLRPEDYERFAGFDARIETHEPLGIEGRKRFKGRLRGLDGDTVVIRAEDGDQRVPFASIRKAKLLLTDELIEASQQRPL